METEKIEVRYKGRTIECEAQVFEGKAWIVGGPGFLYKFATGTKLHKETFVWKKADGVYEPSGTAVFSNRTAQLVGWWDEATMKKSGWS